MSYPPRTYRYSHGAEMRGLGENDESGMRDTSQLGPQQPQEQANNKPPSRQERNFGFTMFRPDEKKRTHLEQVAKREIEEANARREARRIQHIRETPRRVGGEVNYSTAVMQKQKAVNASTSGLEMQKKREKWQREKREAEEREHRERKEKARAQAERNEVLRAVRTQEMAERNREAHRWKNQEFLDRLEQGGRYNGY